MFEKCWWCLKKPVDPKKVYQYTFCSEHVPEKTGQKLTVQYINGKPSATLECPP